MTNLGGGSVPCHAMQLLDRDGDEEVSYDEFCRYCVMLPASQASTKYISATAWLAACLAACMAVLPIARLIRLIAWLACVQPWPHNHSAAHH